MKNLIRTIVNTFYDNIIEEEVWDQDIIIFIANVIKVKELIKDIFTSARAAFSLFLFPLLVWGRLSEHAFWHQVQKQLSAHKNFEWIH